MATLDDAPLTRREFQAFRDESRQDSHTLGEEMRQTLQHYATKAGSAGSKSVDMDAP